MKIPFDSAGNLKHTVSYCTKSVIWKENYTFVAALKYVSYKQNNSTVGIIMRDVDTQVEYYMFMSEFDKIMKYYAGVIDYLEWTFRKQGSRYSICLAQENALEEIL